MTHLRKMMLEELERRNYAQNYHRLLHPNDRGFCASLSAPSGSAHSGAHPRVPSVISSARESYAASTVTQRLAALRFFVHADDQESLERSRYTLPEKDATPTQYLEPRRSGPPHRRRPRLGFIAWC